MQTSSEETAYDTSILPNVKIVFERFVSLKRGRT